jgi:hypothetical protein
MAPQAVENFDSAPGTGRIAAAEPGEEPSPHADAFLSGSSREISGLRLA